MIRFYKIWGVFVIAIFLVSCNGAGTKSTPTLVPTPIMAEKPTYSVQRGTVTRTVQLNGRVTPVKQQELFFRSDGFVKEVLVKSGDNIASGEVLARLDEPERYQVDVTTAELAIAQAQGKLDQTLLDSPIQLAKAKTALEQALKDLEKAKNSLAALKYPHVTDKLTLEKFRTDFAIAKQNYEDAQARYDGVSGRPETDLERADALNALITARRVYYLALYNLNWADGKITQAEIDLAKINFDQAQGTYDKAAAEVQHWQADSSTGEVSLAKLALADAEARLALARKAQEAVVLRAPFAGQVLSLGVAPGSSIKAFQAVLMLADPARLEIRAVPAADDLSLLGIGQEAVVGLSSQQGKELSAKITKVPLTISSTTNASTQDTSVHFGLDDAAILFSLGDVATILITIDTRENVLWLPPAAIRTFQGQDFVFVQSGGMQRRVNVSLGVKSAERVEIRSGLEEGQTVVGQ